MDSTKLRDFEKTQQESRGGLIKSDNWNVNFNKVESVINQNNNTIKSNFDNIKSSTIPSTKIEDLGQIEDGSIYDQLILTVNMLLQKVDFTTLNSTISDLISSISFDANNGIFTFTRYNGESFTIDTSLENVPATFELVTHDENVYLKITDIAGNVTETNVTSLFNEYTFNDGDNIRFIQNGYDVSAVLIDGSIGSEKLAQNVFKDISSSVETCTSAVTQIANNENGYLKQIIDIRDGLNTLNDELCNIINDTEVYISSSLSSISESIDTADSNAKYSKSYAVGGTGTRNGENTDNSKYYYEQTKTYSENAATTTANALRSEINSTKNDAINSISNAASSVEQTLNEYSYSADSIKSEVEGIANTAKSSIESTASTAETNISNAANSAKSTINNAVSTGKSAINNAVSTGKSDINSSISNAETTLQSYVTSSGINAANAKSSADRAESIASSVSSFTTIVCDELPATGSNGVMYFVPNTNTEGQNIYDEYMWVASTSKFELVGNTGINLDLSKDWNENDSTSDKYIENRTHWKEALSEDVLCFEISSDDGDWFADTVNDNLCFRHRIASSYAINIGNTVIVTINGVDEYKTVVEDYGAPATGEWDEFDDYYIYYYYGEYGIYAYVSSYDTPPSISVKIPAYVNNAEIPSEAFTETSSGPYGSEGYLNNVQFSSYLKLNDTVIVTINDVDYTYTTTEYGQYVMIDDLDINGIYIQSSAYQSVVFVIKSKFSDPPSVSIKTPTIIYHTLNTRYLPSDVVTTDFLYDYVDWESVDDEYDSTSTDPISGVGVADAISTCVPSTRTINGKALSADITLSASDVGAVSTTRKVNNKALSADIALSASDIGLTTETWTFTLDDGTTVTKKVVVQ